MTTATLSAVEIEFDFDPYVVADQLCGGVQPAEEMEACRSLCDAIGREFADAASQLPSSGTFGAAFLAFERQVMSASQACVRAVLKAGIESLDDSARHVFRGARRYRRVPATPRSVMTSAGPVDRAGGVFETPLPVGFRGRDHAGRRASLLCGRQFHGADCGAGRVSDERRGPRFSCRPLKAGRCGSIRPATPRSVIPVEIRDPATGRIPGPRSCRSTSKFALRAAISRSGLRSRACF